MSGLEGLAALGLACSIVQVISFGRETLDVVKGFYRNGTLDDSLMDKSTSIQDLASDIIAVDIPTPVGKYEQKLVDVTKKCTGFARDLQIEIDKVIGDNRKGSLGGTFKTALKARWRKSRLDKMEKYLADSEQLMQTTLLAWIFKTSKTVSTNIDSLRPELRNFVIKYEQGCTKASDLVSKEALQVREAIVRESGKTEKAIQAHVTQTSAELEQKFEKHVEDSSTECRREKLLKSLKYPGMNERTSQVEPAHARTFNWLFADGDELSDSDDDHSLSTESEQLDDEATRSEHDSSVESTTDSTDDDSQEKPPEMVWSNFSDWLQSDLSIYWIMGKPGSGKSTLAKFILSDSRTTTALEHWRPGAIIASHYFWRPGALLQRSIQAMLCSLIYQLLLSVPIALDYATANVTGLSQKDAETDWSVLELQRLCIGLIRSCNKPLCLLIDGLDECGPEDDHKKLLELVDKIMLLNVKIIVTSRNEPVFEKRFRHEPQLRVQDLTAGDLRTYARNELSTDIRDEFLDELVKKADGVFLWLVLAVQSINRGMENTDSPEELRQRIRSLPQRPEEIYKDMLGRLDEDRQFYQGESALYFKLAMADDLEVRLRSLFLGISVLDMMIASLPKTHPFFETWPEISATCLLEKCETFIRRVGVCCAGLLSLSGTPKQVTHTMTQGLGAAEKKLVAYADEQMGFRFIHRSAYDFLVDTVMGKHILGQDGETILQTWTRLLGARLKTVQLVHSMLGNSKLMTNSDYRLLSKQMQPFFSDIAIIAAVRDGTAGDDIAGEDTVRELFSFLYELYISIRPWRKYSSIHPTRIAMFFGEAAGCSGLSRYSIPIIQEQCIGGSSRSAILLYAAYSLYARPGDVAFSSFIRDFVLGLPEVDVNLECPLFKGRNGITAVSEIGPFDHIKISPFAMVLGMVLSRDRHYFTLSVQVETMDLRLISDLVLHGANPRTTLFLYFHLGTLEPFYPGPLYSDSISYVPRFWPILSQCRSRLSESHFEDGFLGVVALQASTVIEKLLASLHTRETGHDVSDELDYSSKELSNSSEVADNNSKEARNAISFLSQKCQEFEGEADDRVLAFLQPGGNYIDVPYRLVSQQDSDLLMDMLWEWLFAGGEPGTDLKNGCLEVLARSPFSSIGFKDLLKDMGHFDELAARELLKEYEGDFMY